MSITYKVARAAGGYKHHAIRAGSFAAMCGFEPGKNARQRCMVDRSGWRVPNRVLEITCIACKAAIAEHEKGKA